MHILFLARSLGFGGAERQLVVLAKALKARGHSVAVALFYPGGPLDGELALAGIPIHSIGKRGRWDLVGPLVRLTALLHREAPHVLHGYLPAANILAVLAGRLVPGVRVVLGVRASDMDLRRYDIINRLVYALEARLAGSADLIIANSRSGLRAAWARGLPSGRGLVFPNGIDTARFRPDSHARAQWRDKLGIGPSTRLIGMVARLDPMKGHDIFLEAARILALRHPDVVFVAAGLGVGALAGRVARCGAPVRLLEALDQPEELMAALDLAVSASLYGEGFSNAIAEAMACGVPCVVTDVGDSAELVGSLGEVVPAGDAAALAAAMVGMLGQGDDPMVRQACRSRIEAEYSVERLASRSEGALAALERPPIVHVITGLGPGGAEGMLARLACAATDYRHVVASMTGDGLKGVTLRNQGVEVVDLGLRRGQAGLRGLLRLIRLVRRLRPCLVQTWLYHADLLGLLAAGFAGGLPVVWNLRCSNMRFAKYNPLTRWVVRLLAMLSRRPAAVIVNSQAGQDAHAQFGYRPRAWHLLPNGVDTVQFRPDPSAREAWRRRLGVPEHVTLVGMVARRDPMKDHEGFLTAAARVAEMTGAYAFVIAGAGVDADETLRALAGQVKAPVVMIGHVEDLPGLFASLDIFVLASRFGEGFPNVVAEAMACGIPCVVADVGDAAGIVAETGVVVPAEDSAILAQAIHGLASDRAGAQMRGHAARTRIEVEYALPKVVARYEAVWTQVREGG